MAIAGGASIWTAESFGIEMLDLTIGCLLDRQAERQGAREALIFRDADFGIGLTWSYAELQAQVIALAAGLLALGVARRDRVAVLAPNFPQWILLEYALAKVGAVLVTVNTSYREHELDYLLRQGRVQVLFAVEAYRGNDYLANLRRVEEAAPLPDLRHRVLIGDGAAPGWLRFDDVVRQGQTITPATVAQRQDSVRPDDAAQIQYTSGTTGAPKGVVLTHRGLVNNARFMSLRAGWSESDRLLAIMPLFHTAGVSATCSACSPAAARCWPWSPSMRPRHWR